MLSTIAFTKICNQLGKPLVDLFATNYTAQCKKFVSWFPCPFAANVDAFSIEWNEFFYAFPPFSLIARVLKKIRSEKCRGIVVAPKWPTQPWYPDFMAMKKSKVLFFGPTANLIFSPFSSSPNPLNKTLILMAAILSGDL